MCEGFKQAAKDETFVCQNGRCEQVENRQHACDDRQKEARKAGKRAICEHFEIVPNAWHVEYVLNNFNIDIMTSCLNFSLL